MVALSGGAEGQTLIRRAARIAARCGADLLAVHITRPGGRAAALTAGLVAQRQLTESLGGTYHQLTSGDVDDVAAALLTFVPRRPRHPAGPRHGPPLLAVSSAAQGPDHLPGHPRAPAGTQAHVHIVTTRTPRTVRPNRTRAEPGKNTTNDPAEHIPARPCPLTLANEPQDSSRGGLPAATPFPHGVIQALCRVDDQVRPLYRKLLDQFAPAAFLSPEAPRRPASPRQPSGGKLWHLPPPGRRPAAAGTSEDYPARRRGRSLLAGRPLGPADPWPPDHPRVAAAGASAARGSR